MSRVGKVRIRNLWLHSIILGLALLVLTTIYNQISRVDFQPENIISARNIGQSAANTALIMIGLSFAMSGLTYFWDFVDTKIIYRKYFGLTGFYIALIHVFYSLVFIYRDPFGELGVNKLITSFVFGILAIFIFIMMATISNKFSVTELGGKAWRKLLRVGYIGYAFAVIHLFARRWGDFKALREGFILPPLSQLTAAFAIGVLLLRIVLAIAIELKRRKTVPDQVQDKNNKKKEEPRNQTPPQDSGSELSPQETSDSPSEQTPQDPA